MSSTDSVFQRAASKLLAEILDGPVGTEAFILNPGDPGLHQQLQSISAERASQQPIPGKPSIAAHVDHVHYGLSLLNRWFSGEENPWSGADGNASWRRTVIADDEWSTLRDSLRDEANAWRNNVAKRTEWDDMSAAAAISTVAHTAYHLGALRQIMAAVK